MRYLLKFLAFFVLLSPPVPAHADSLAGIAVAPHQHRHDYKRAAFGEGWPDDGHGCDVRDDILARDMQEVSYTRTSKCPNAVESGKLNDPYTGRVIDFSRQAASAVQIDHIVPLAYAWDMGAASWSDDQRHRFYTDPQELLAVSGAANQAKGDLAPGAWMPPNSAFFCHYLALWEQVSRAYSLPIDTQSADVVERGNCG